MTDFTIDTPVGANPEDRPELPGYDSGDNAEVNEASPIGIQDPVLEQFQREEYKNKWCDELEASKKERKDWLEKGYLILERWGDKRVAGTESRSLRSSLNLLYAYTELKMGALYARTPDPDVKRRWNDPDDQVGRVASIVLERDIEFELDEDNFDSTFKCILFDRLTPGMGIGWARLAQEGGQQITGPHYGEEVPQIDPMTGQQVVDPDTQEPVMVPHPLADQLVRAPITYQCAHVEHVSWDDFLWSPCRTWNLTRWVARRVPMSKQAVDDRFGSCCPEEMLAGIAYENGKNTGDEQTPEDHIRTKNQVESTTDVYEIWDKELKKIWHICESCPVPLDVQEDSVEFPGFFPTPMPPLGRFDGSNTIPNPDYIFAQDLYEDVNDTHNRAVNMIRAAQVKGLYNANIPAIQTLFTTTPEFRFQPVDSWNVLQEQGGIKGNMEFVPVEQFAQAAQLLTQTEDVLIQRLQEVEGINDILKAETATNETQLATQLKGAFGTSRLAIIQRDIANYIQSLLRLKAHLICKFYTPEQIVQRIGTLLPADQQLLPQALQLLKNEQLRSFKLEVSVDSIQLPNWNLEKSDKISFIQAISQYIQQAMPMVQQNPQMIPLVMTLIQWFIAGFKGAQYVEGEIDSILQKFQQAAASGQLPKPQPNPQQVKAQAQQQKTQADVQIAQEQERTKRMDVITTAQTDQERLRIEAAEAQTDRMKVAAQVHDTMQNSIHDHAIDQLEAHDMQKNSIHKQAMDRMDAKPDLTIVLGPKP
jgi:hypothetical protein